MEYEELEKIIEKHFRDNRLRELNYDYGTEIRWARHKGGFEIYVASSDGEIPLKTFHEPTELNTFLTILFSK